TVGGDVATGGVGSTGSGNLAVVPVTEPTDVFGNAAAGIGNATAGAYNSDSSRALGNAYTPGDGSSLSSNAVTAPVAGANDVFASGASAIGNAAGTAGNDVTASSGGYTGTTGTASTGSGNIGQLPVAAPVETYGLAGSLGGTSAGTVPTETKSVRAGGSPNSKDDGGTASSNVVAAPTAVPAQVFGDAAGVVANTGAAANNDSTVRAGGDPTAAGTAGTASGNIVQLATATPAQVFDDGASVVGNGTATGENDTTIGSGGAATANGRDGTASGDIVNVPDSGPIQVFGVAGASPGNEEADSLNNTYTTAGAGTTTNGDHGALAGDVVTAQATQVEQVLGAGLAAAGNSNAVGVDNTATRSGGDVTTSGEWGALSGDLVGVPATDVTQAVADGVSVVGNQRAFGGNTTSAASGGDMRTAGDGFLNGTELVRPFGADVTIFRVPVEVLGRAIEHGFSSTSIVDSGSAPDVDVPFGASAPEQQFGPSDAVDGLLRADQVPAIGDLLSVPNLRRSVPGAPLSTLDMSQTQVFPAISSLGAAPGLPGLPRVPGVPGFSSVPGLSALEMTQRLPVISHGPVVPANRPGIQSRPTVQAQPAPSGLRYLPMTGELPVAGQLPAPRLPSPSLPTGGLPTAGLPTGGLAPSLPTSGLHAPSLPTPGMPSGLPGGALHAPTLPTSGAGPVSASVPTVTKPNVPAMPSLSTIPDLPPVPTLPAMPPLPRRPSAQDLPAAPALPTPSLPVLSGTSLPTLPAPSVTGPSVPALPTPHVPGTQDVPVPSLPTPSLPTPGLSAPSLFAPNIPAVPSLPKPSLPTPSLPTPGLPTSGLPVPAVPSVPAVGTPHVQDVPAGSAQQLMAQLRALISDLENSASGSPTQLRPMGDIQPPTI
ncbi:MAG TPA: hypothetical protein VH352_11725, partial [Pseudonocardiaceae bacterium]|nr:hypothetical protein [Pseudonocardiaceae bacterium]